MAFLTKEESNQVAEAVAQAELKTGGEIVVAIIPESDDYAGKEFLFALLMGILAFFIAAWNTTGISALLNTMFWNPSPILLPLSVGTIGFAAASMAYALAQIPALDRLIVGKRVMELSVKKRAMRHFAESGVYDTQDATGVLLFLSVLERRVELIADRGIHEKIAPDTWDRIVSALSRSLKENKGAQALVHAVQEIGIVLAEHVPPREDDENEKGDAPIELEKGS